MPYPAKVNKERIVQYTHNLIERDGADAVSLSKIAAQLGIKAPSLYRHIGNKEKLLQAVNVLTLEQLFAALDIAAQEKVDVNAHDLFVAIAMTFRQFGLENPNTYQLFSSSRPGEIRPNEDLLLNFVLPLQTQLAEIAGEAQSLTALRGLFALIHGYILLELNQQFQRGGSLEHDCKAAVEAYLKGWNAN